MTIESSDPGPGRGRLHSDGGHAVRNPLGLLAGDAAKRAVRAGSAQSLADGAVAFSLIETLTPGMDGIGVRSFLPSMTNTGRIRSWEVNRVSATMRRDQSVMRLRRCRVLGKVP